MTWESTDRGTARRTTQERFRIFHEQLEFACPEHLAAMDKAEKEGQISKDEFAKELLDAMGDDISIADLRSLSKIFHDELKRREIERTDRIKYQNKAFDNLIEEMKRDHPVAYENAKTRVKQYIADIKSGKEKLIITEFRIVDSKTEVDSGAS